MSSRLQIQRSPVLSLACLLILSQALCSAARGQNAPTNPVLANPVPANRVPTDSDPNTSAPSSETTMPANGSSETELTEDSTLVEPAAASDITRYSNNMMAVSLPKGWTVEEIDNGVMVSNVTTVPSELVATQIVSIAAPPGAVVNANIDSFMEEGATVGRYRTTTIDNQSALVMWLAERPDDLSSAIATFVGYGSQTVLLFSRYAPENEIAEEKILQMHVSFANLAIQTAEIDSPEADSPEADLSEETAVEETPSSIGE